MNLKNNAETKIKYFLLSLMVFGGFQAFSKLEHESKSLNKKIPLTPPVCNASNYKNFINDKEATDELIENTKKGCDLRKLDLIKANLSKAYLPKANLSGTNFSGAILSEADFSNSILRGTIFNNADLSGAIFSEAYSTHAQFSHAILKEADLTNSRFFWAKFIQANLSNANLTNANLGGSTLILTLFTDAILTKATFPKQYKHLLTKEQQKQVKEFL